MRHQHRAFTIIELTLTMVVISICVSGVIALFVESARQAGYSEALKVGTSLAQGVMEDVIMKGFKSAANRSLTSFASPFNSYSSQVQVSYVRDDLATTSGTQTEYKKIEVTVTHPLVNSLVLQTVLADHADEE